MLETATPTLPDSDWLPVCTCCHVRVDTYVELAGRHYNLEVAR